MTNSLDELSAAELFELAQRRQQEEKDRQREALKEQVEALRVISPAYCPSRWTASSKPYLASLPP